VNRLKMANIDSIMTLHRRRWSIRRIAKELGVHRDTVARHIHVNQQSTGLDAAAEGAPEFKLGHAEGGAHGAKLGQAPIGAEAPTAEAFFEAEAPPEKASAEGALPDAPASASKQASLCEPWRAVIQVKLQVGLTGQEK